MADPRLLPPRGFKSLAGGGHNVGPLTSCEICHGLPEYNGDNGARRSTNPGARIASTTSFVPDERNSPTIIGAAGLCTTRTG